MQWIDRSPFRVIKLFKIDKKKQRFYFTKNHLKLIFEKGPKYNDFYTFLLKTGLRSTDTYKLRRKHISSNLKGTICDQCLNNRRADYDPLMLVEMRLKKESQIDKESAALSKRFSDLKVTNLADDVII